MDATENKTAAGTAGIEVEAGEFSAGADMTLALAVTTDPLHDLSGAIVVIRDQDGAEVTHIALSEFDGEKTLSGEFVVKAPKRAGAYQWTATLMPHEAGGVSFPETARAFSIVARAH